MTPIPILVYHSVCADASSAYQRFTVTPDELDAQLGALAPLGCTPVPLAAVTRAAYALRGALVRLAGRLRGPGARRAR